MEEVNALTETFLSDIGLEVNDVLNRFKPREGYLSYGFKRDFGVALPKEKPFFVLPISSVAHINTDVLRYALDDFIKSVKEEDEV